MLYNFTYMKYPEQANLQRHDIDLWLPEAGERKEQEVTANGHKEYL